jgi:methylglutaconyl-CoA hydratase
MTRAARRNALSPSLVAALRQSFASVPEGGETRIVVLAGEGPAFCAGGDITEYARASAIGTGGTSAEGLADLLTAITACPVPVVARVHGAAYGGGVGLLCAADVVVAEDGAQFSLSEARLGLVPAAIAPFVIAALGVRQAKAQMLLAAPFGVTDALRFGLVHRRAAAGALDAVLDETLADLLRSPPGALATVKRLPAWLDGLDESAQRAAIVRLHGERLASDEGREGLRAFLEKRSAAWTRPSTRS